LLISQNILPAVFLSAFHQKIVKYKSRRLLYTQHLLRNHHFSKF